MARRPKDAPTKKPREYWIEGLKSQLARTSYAVSHYSQINTGFSLTNSEIEDLIDGVVRALVSSQKDARAWKRSK